MLSFFARLAWKALIALALTVASYDIRAQSANTIADETTYGDGSTALDTMEIITAPVPLMAVSRKTHCCLVSAGDFFIDLPLTGTAGIECRKGDGPPTYDIYQVIVTFDQVVTNHPGTVTVTGQIGTPMATSHTGFPGGPNDVTVELSSVANMQTITITLSGVGVNGDGSAVIPMGILCADTNGNGTVNSTDVVQTKIRSGPVTSATFRSDVNHDGLVDAGDTIIVRKKVGTALPP
jgi:hypothetical protein